MSLSGARAEPTLVEYLTVPHSKGRLQTIFIIETLMKKASAFVLRYYFRPSLTFYRCVLGGPLLLTLMYWTRPDILSRFDHSQYRMKTFFKVKDISIKKLVCWSLTFL